ncbi:MAG TPA: insulinase family protein [Thermoplasmata archaeon]|nr:insulinase family protein [Thermoplasmata archaeon]
MNLPDRAVLDNGAVVVSQPLPSNPFIAFRGSVPAGTFAEGEEHGVAEFASRLLLGGTRRMSAAKIADRLEGIGATLEFHNTQELLLFSGRCTRETAAETVRILVECVSQPAFPAREVERVRGELRNDLRIEEDDTRQRAYRELLRIVFPKDHPYGRDPKGGEERVRRIRRSDLVAFHGDHVGPDGLIFAVTGDVDRGLIEKAVATPLSRFRGKAEPARSTPPPAYKPRHLVIDMPHKSQADVVLGAPAVPRRHDDYYALLLANLLLGRIGLFGRLGKNLRDELGLAYYAYSSLDARTAAGMWSINVGLNPSNLARGVQGIRDELGRLRTEPFAVQEIADGKDNQVGSLVVSLERNAEVAAELHRMEHYGLGMDFLERYGEIIQGLTDEAVRDAAVKYFSATPCSWVVTGPAKGTKLAL